LPPQPPQVAVTVKVVSASDQSPVPGATVVAFTNFAQGVAAHGEPNEHGEVKLDFGRPFATLERVYVYPRDTYWSSLAFNVSLSNGSHLQLKPIDFDAIDCVRHFCGLPSSEATLGKGVVVGVVDTGVATTHAELKVAGGFNSVPGENPTTLATTETADTARTSPASLPPKANSSASGCYCSSVANAFSAL
jgi:subtilisin